MLIRLKFTEFHTKEEHGPQFVSNETNVEWTEAVGACTRLIYPPLSYDFIRAYFDVFGGYTKNLVNHDYFTPHTPYLW